MGDDKNEQQKTHRFDAWIILAISSAIALGSMVDLYTVRGSKEKWSISCAAITMSNAVIVAVMYKFKSDLVVGTMVERCCIAVSTILWVICLALSFHDSVFLDMSILFSNVENPSILNANVYYFSWISFFASVYLLADFHGEEFDASEALKKRFTKWLGLLAFSLVVMSSSISFFQQDRDYCNEKSESCSRIKLAMLVGLINSFLSLLAVLLVPTTCVEKFQLYIETGLSFFTTVIYAVTVGYITGGDSPGSIIGNLYYFTWLSLFASVLVFSSCVNEIKFGTKDETEEPAAAPKDAPSVEESPTIEEEHHEEPAQEQAQVAENV